MATLLLLVLLGGPVDVRANPTGGTVTQGSATFSTAGPQFTVTQTSGTAFVNWQSFNIGAGETTTFVQPSASSVIWNQINDVNPSQILGNLNANGYVVLQNASGFYVGGNAAITAHGLIMTTASTPPLNLSSGGSWQFDAPPPTAKIINYGRINITGGGSGFLIASDIENASDGTHVGTVSAPGGRIGLYAGQKVLVSMSPDGRGLSAHVTLPEGSVDNEGKLIADAGMIAAQAQFVNQNGLVQANSVLNNNGVIEFVASDSLNLGPNSTITARGDSTSAAASPGGFVVLNAGNTFADTASSTIDVSGNSLGATGFVEIFGGNIVDATSIQSGINGVPALSFFAQNRLFINPYDLTFSADPTDPISANVQFSDLTPYSQIDFHALDNISLGSDWSLANQISPASISLTAGNNINLDYSIKAGNNWSVGLTAGAGSSPADGSIYLNGGSVVQSQDGNINFEALNNVIVNSGAVRTLKGGSINVTAETGDVNSGLNTGGYAFGLGNKTAGPYYSVNAVNLGGISTAAGGNVTINAGQDVISYFLTPVPTDDPNIYTYKSATTDAGTGAFGPQAGNVTITAGRNVFGHYVVANGTGMITAGSDVGAPATVLNGDSTHPAEPLNGFALSLIKGAWTVDAPNGSIYVQDVRNPNGIFGENPNGKSTAANYTGYHYFDYDPSASVTFNAGDSVEINSGDPSDAWVAPHIPKSATTFIPLILPPSLTVSTGSGNFVLDSSVILFPSADQSLNLNIGGNFLGIPNGNPISLSMSDSASHRWTKDGDFGTTDHAATLVPENNSDPVKISVGNNLTDVNLYTTKATEITVGGDMINSGFVGQNQKAGDITSINVTGQIYNSPFYTFADLTAPITSANPTQPTVWDSVFLLAVNPDLVAQITSFDAKTAPGPGQNALQDYLKLNNYLLFPSDLGNSESFGSNPGFLYDPSSKQLGFAGNTGQLITPTQLAALEGGTFYVLKADSKGVPILDANNHLQVIPYAFSAAPAIAGLYANGLKASSDSALGLQIGGPGQFNIHAGSMDLGNSPGIVSYGFGGKYGYLQGATGAPGFGGAAINLNVDGNVNMITSAIDSIDGGNVNVKVGGDLKISQGNFDFQNSSCYGIYTSGYSDVHVTAGGDIDIGSGCIGAFNGGSVYVTSLTGDVNAGNGANKALFVYGIFLSPSTGLPIFGTIGDLADPAALQADPAPYGSGILAEFPTAKYLLTGGLTQPGNIFVDAPKGNIISSRGGISQFALNGSIAGGPVVTLNAGTPGVPATTDQGNISLGQGGVVGGTINITASGTVEGLIVSRQNANINVAQGFSGTVLSGGSANFSGGGSVAGTVVGIGGVSVAGNASVTATVLSQNVTIGNGASISTLGTSANATSASQSAAQQSSSDAKQQLASDDSNTDNDKQKKRPALLHVKRVTVILPRAS